VARRGRDWPLKTASTFAVGARRKPTEPRMAPLGASDVAGNRAAFARLSRGPALGRADPGTAWRNPRRGCLNFLPDVKLCNRGRGVNPKNFRNDKENID
jgi:hypothetical protein